MPNRGHLCSDGDRLPDLFGSPTCPERTAETVSETVYPVLSSLAPVISVGYGANPVQIRSFTPLTGVQIPLGTPNDFTGLTCYPFIAARWLHGAGYKMPHESSPRGALPFPTDPLPPSR